MPLKVCALPANDEGLSQPFTWECVSGKVRDSRAWENLEISDRDETKPPALQTVSQETVTRSELTECLAHSLNPSCYQEE